MILDHLRNAPLYASLHPRLSRGFAYLAKTNLAALPAGKQTIDGENLFVLVNDYQTQPLAQYRFESHRKYTDIQFMVRGTEQIGVADVGTMSDTLEPYAVERDIAFYAGTGDRITLSEGMFAVFFPHDAHQPGIAVAEPTTVRKVVVKVALD